MPHKPYIIVGAEQLTASIYKTGDEFVGFNYRFNIVRLNDCSGCVNQWFRPTDLVALVKLTGVLVAELASDGCIDPELRKQFIFLAAALDEALVGVSPAFKS